ncbi:MULTISPECIES: hypothetical protein [Klebsiella pneumoniae complex]|uniref:hypothetical protein n=1 Tax=Klebsiella pneumoniae complex TaxID=3390273 RepID=UPI0009BBC52C|nr:MULTISPECIES: hypothetical protein [Klebsiella]EKX4094432.1 hypothetical protein [Klebsiella pneumoniae]ELB4290234.1 hypothetical protein [Klebsiella pneumoniae]MBE0234931.1 hypothetical protein [Klebsiella pneumoniae]MBK5787173.1 hypothetical protein [Klebsiella pneumoniae]MBZ1658174.1 hypothetical protein [Klebsiella pneumoniae]
MSKSKNIKDAMESLKVFRTSAQTLSEKQLELLTKIINKASEISVIDMGERTPEEQAILDFYFSISTEVSASIKAAEEYNKAINDYVNGVNILNTIASYQNESN